MWEESLSTPSPREKGTWAVIRVVFIWNTCQIQVNFILSFGIYLLYAQSDGLGPCHWRLPLRQDSGNFSPSIVSRPFCPALPVSSAPLP